MKQLHDNNTDYELESFSGCLALVLRPNVGSSTVSSGSKSHVPRQGNPGNACCRGGELTRDQFCLFAEWSSRFQVYLAQIYRHCSSLRASRMTCLPVANVRECDDFGASAVIDVDAKPEKLTWPFRTKCGLYHWFSQSSLTHLPSRIKTLDRHCWHIAQTLCWQIRCCKRPELKSKLNFLVRRQEREVRGRHEVRARE